MHFIALFNRCVIAALLCTLAACGGGGEASPPAAPAPPPVVPPAPPPTGTLVGANGGTVTGPSGAKVVIPAGALTTDVRIDIEQITTGAPALPAGFTAYGPMFAFTPHGTTFALPVTMTLPFNPALVSAGAIPQFYKTTNGQTQWEQVANATFGASSVSAQVTSFSQAGVVIPPLSAGVPVRLWSFKEYRGDDLTEFDADGGTAIGGFLEARHEFGQAYSSPWDFSGGFYPHPQFGTATGVITSSTDGNTHQVGTKAPLGNAIVPADRIGSKARLVQYQTFVKNAADASLTLTVGSAFLEAFDGNGVLGRRCPDEHVSPQANGLPISRSCDLIKAEIYLDLQAYTADPNTSASIFFRISGGATVNGSAIGETLPTLPFPPPPPEPSGSWDTGTWTSSRTALWTTEDFDFSEYHFNGPAGDIEMSLARPITFSVDLSSIGVGSAFTLKMESSAFAYNRAAGVAGGQHAEFETAANASLSSPLGVGGTTVTTAGLTLIDTPMPLVEPVEAAVVPAACVPGPGPDPAAGLLQFSATSYTQLESNTTPIVTVTRSNGSTGAVTATFTTRDGSGVAGVDYTAVNSTVFFAAHDTVPRVVPVPIIQDQISAEPDRTVSLTLSEPGGCAALGAQTTAILTIRDDDVAPPPTLFTVGGTVTGLGVALGAGLVLEDLHGLFLEIAGNGPFTFSSLPSASGAAYSVRVFRNPRNLSGHESQTCTVANGTGFFTNANVTNVVVTCVDVEP